MDISSKLKQFHHQGEVQSKAIYDFCHESAFARTKKDIIKLLAESESYRVSILKHVPAFSNLSIATIGNN